MNDGHDLEQPDIAEMGRRAAALIRNDGMRHEKERERRGVVQSLQEGQRILQEKVDALQEKVDALLALVKAGQKPQGLRRRLGDLVGGRAP